MPATTTSSQPMPLAPINTGLRSRSDSNGMGSPTSLMSSFSSDSILTPVFTESSGSSGSSDEEPSIAASIAPLMNEKTVRPHHTLHHTQTMDSRNSTESVDSLGGPLKFNDLGRGRHSNSWLFRSVSIRSTIRTTYSKIVTKH